MTNTQRLRSIRLIAIGDCNTSGVVDCERTYSVPQLVCEQLSDTGVTTTLQNLGYTMSTTREGIMRARLQAEPADVLLLNFGLVDAWKTSIPGIYVPYFPDSRLRKIGRKLLKLIKKRLRHPFLRRLLPYGHVVGLAEFEANLVTITREVRRRAPDLCVICWGCAPTRNDEARNTCLKEYDQVLAKVATPNGVYVDTRSLIESHPLKDMLLDEVHLSHKGCELVSDAISQALIKILPH